MERAIMFVQILCLIFYQSGMYRLKICISFALNHYIANVEKKRLQIFHLQTFLHQSCFITVNAV